MTDESTQPAATRSAALARAVAAGCVVCLVLILAVAPPALSAQERTPAPRLRFQAAGALLEGGAASPLLRPGEAPGLADALRDAAAAATGVAPARRAGDGLTAVPLFREVSALERGWRIVGEDRSRGAADLEDAAWAAPGDDRTEEPGEPPFLVRLFDAGEIMAWVREAKAWGMDARRTLFGPRGIVRAGSVPGSARPRLRLELTDSRPGFQVVIITR